MTFEWIKGHSGIEGNEGADALAALGAQKPVEDDIDLAVPNNWNLTEVKVPGMSQAVAYKIIRALKKRTPRAGAEANLNETYHCIVDHLGGRHKTTTEIW